MKIDLLFSLIVNIKNLDKVSPLELKMGDIQHYLNTNKNGTIKFSKIIQICSEAF